MSLEFSRHIFEKYTNMKFHGNLSSGSGVVPCGWTDGETDIGTDRQTNRQTDRHDESNSRFSQFLKST